MGVSVRYRPSNDVKLGDLSAYVVHDVQAGRNEWKYKYQHSQDNLPGGFRGVVDVEDFSNLEFFRRYDRDPRLHTLSQIYSSAYLTKNRSGYSLNILTDRRDILLSNVDPNNPFAPPPRQRFEQLPSLQFRLYPNRIGESPFYYSLESSMSHLATSGLINGPTANYYRADIFPTLSMQLHTPAWFSVRPQVSVRETYYSDSLSDDSVANPLGKLTAVNDPIERFYAQGQVEVVGPSFSRIFNDSFGGFSKFKHVIEPRFRYLYTTDVNDQNRIIRFDTVDSPFLPIVRDSVEYSLTQRLIGREAGANGSSREVASFSLTQSVSLGRAFTNATAGGLSGSTVPQQGKFTPLVAGLHVNPYQSVTLDASATFGNISHQLDQTSLSANLLGTGVRADKYLSFTWFSSYRQPPVNGAVVRFQLQPDPPQQRLVAVQQPHPRGCAAQLRRQERDVPRAALPPRRHRLVLRHSARVPPLPRLCPARESGVERLAFRSRSRTSARSARIEAHRCSGHARRLRLRPRRTRSRARRSDAPRAARDYAHRDRHLHKNPRPRPAGAARSHALGPNRSAHPLRDDMAPDHRGDRAARRLHDQLHDRAAHHHHRRSQRGGGAGRERAGVLGVLTIKRSG